MPAAAPRQSETARPARPRFLLGLAVGVKRLLQMNDDHPPAGAGVRREPRALEQQEPISPRAASATVGAGRLNLLGLTEIRDQLGPRWEALSEKVHLIAQGVVTKHLVRGDVFERYGEDGYVVLFARLSPAEAAFKCRAIRNEIGRQLLGSEWEGLSKVAVDFAEVERDALASGNVEQVLAAAFQQGGTGEAAPGLGHGDGAKAALDCSAGPATSAPAAQVVSPRPPKISPSWQPAAPGGNVTQAALADPVDEVAAADVARDAGTEPVLVNVADEAAAAPAPRPAEQATWSYSPVWDFRNMVLIRFRLTAHTPHGRRVHPHVDDREPASEARLFERDLQGLLRVLRDLAALSLTGRRLPVICPVHQSSLSRGSWRTELVQATAKAPPHVRRLLTIEVVGPPDKTSSHSIRSFADVVGRLGVCFASCIAAAGPLFTYEAPSKTISVELTDGARTEATAIRILSALAQSLAKPDIQLGVYSLDSRPLVLAAATSGFRFLSGSAIHPEVPGLDHATRYDLGDFYREFLPGQ